MFDLVIRNGRIVTPHDDYHADIGVTGGAIAAIGVLGAAEAADVFDAAGLVVMPGIIDEHVHSRDPGLTHKEDFSHSTRAAAAGGVTTVLEMPNSVPPVADADSFASRCEALSGRAHVDYGLWGMVLGDVNRNDLAPLADAGVIGFKLFWGYALDRRTKALVYNPRPGDDVIPPPDHGQVFEAFATIGATGRPVAIHAEDAEIIARAGIAESASGSRDYAAFLRTRPVLAEALTTAAGIRIAHAAGAHLHVLHMASAEGPQLVARARLEGIRVTGETCPHYLVLCDEDYGRAGVAMKIYPPIRERRHQDALWQALHSGGVQTLGSDHAPHADDEKQGDIFSAPAGAATIDSTVPLMLDAVSKGKLTLGQVAALLSENPARVWGLYGKKGAILVGADADFTIVDLEREHVIDADRTYSKSRVNPYHGLRTRGAPVAAFVRGRQVMDQGAVDGEPIGTLIRPVADAQAFW